MRAILLTAMVLGLGLPACVVQAQPTAPAIPSSGPAPAQLAPGTPIPPAELDALVDGVVRQAMARDHIAGVAVSVVQDGRVILKKGYGFAGPNRPVDPDVTSFRIASISKTFTWIAAMKEVEAGRMRLDGPINADLPADLAVPDAHGWRQVELIDLMTHRPGFEDRSLDHLFTRDPARIRTLATQLRLARPARVFAPGTTPAYSNYGAALAGAAVAHLEHAPFQDVVEREIIGPLGMTHTSFREPYPPRPDLPAPMSAALAADRSVGYRWDGVGFEAQPPAFLTQGAPAGAASSTAADMARYMLMILGGGRLDGVTIYGPAAAQGFRSPVQIAPGVWGTAHGFMTFQLPGGFVGHGHDGDIVWFHASMVTIPDLDLGVFVATNTDTGPRLANELPGLIVEHFYASEAGTPRPGAPQLWRQRGVYDGTFLVNRRPFSGLEKFVFLMIGQSGVAVTRDGRLIAPGAFGPAAWVPSGPPGAFRSVDGAAALAFEIKGGKAVREYLSDGLISADRIGPLYQRGVLARIAVLVLIAAVATLIGPAVRFRRALPRTRVQAAADAAQIAAAALWLLALAAGIVFALHAADQAAVLYRWPEPSILVLSCAALAAAALSALGLALAPFVWGRADGWRAWRKLRYSTTAVLFAALAVQLAFWGALQPWAA